MQKLIQEARKKAAKKTAPKFVNKIKVALLDLVDEEGAVGYEEEIGEAVDGSLRDIWSDVWRARGKIKWGPELEKEDYRYNPERGVNTGCVVKYPKGVTVSRSGSYSFWSKFEHYISVDLKKLLNDSTLKKAVQEYAGVAAKELLENGSLYMSEVSALHQKIENLAWQREKISYDSWYLDEDGEKTGLGPDLDIRIESSGDYDIKSVQSSGGKIVYSVVFPIRFDVSHIYFPTDDEYHRG